MIEDMTIRKITPKTQQGYIRTAKNSNDEIRAIGDASALSLPLRISLRQPALFGRLQHEFQGAGLSVVQPRQYREGRGR
jgi:hypothetical protein